MEFSKRRLVYLGWQGFNNFGDDLLHEAWKYALDDNLDIEAPLFIRDYIKRGFSFLKSRLKLVGSESLILLGGGTTIGFSSWAGHAHNAVNFYGSAGIVLAGAGAAAGNDSYALGLQESNWKRWRQVPGAVLFGVRGPLTAVECELNWQKPCPVIGDPALMYPTVAGVLVDGVRDLGTVGVCLGSQTSTRFSVETVAEGIKAAIASSNELVEAVVFQLADSDAEVAQELSKELGGAKVAVYNGDVKQMLLQISECSVFVSERLHGAVAAVSVGVPAVPLSYASKCDDFWLSVAESKPLIQVGHTAEELASEIQACQQPERVARIAGNRDKLIQHLLKSALAIKTWKEGAISVSELVKRAFLMRHEEDLVRGSVVPSETSRSDDQDRAEATSADMAVVVPYGSGLELLRFQVKRLMQQDYSGRIEIVVACNASFTPAGDMFEGPLPANISLRSIDATSVPGPSFARNVGWRATSSPIVAFCDADDEVDIHWLSGLARALAKADVVGGRLSYDLLNDPHDASWHYQTTQGLPRKFRHLDFVPSCNLGAKRTVLEKLEGFAEDTRFGEDIDFCWRAQYAGFQLSFAPDAVVEYRLRTGLREIWNQSFRYGASDAALLARHRLFGARRPLADSIVEGLATPWAALAMLLRPRLVRKFITRAGNQAGRMAGRVRAKAGALESLTDDLGL